MLKAHTVLRHPGRRRMRRRRNCTKSDPGAVEARAELFGVRLSGVHEGISAPWEECIGPSGRSVYVFMRSVQEGRLSIESDGRACFAYAEDGYALRSCYVVQREGANYRFDRFVTHRVERGVDRCEDAGAYVEAPPAGSSPATASER